MRLATFNVLHGRSPQDGRVDLDRYADAVASLDADVLALQEVDRDQPRSGGADLTAVAAEAMGAPEHRFVAALSGMPGATWEAATGSEQPGTASYGIALLSRHPVESWEVVRLPSVPTRVPVLFPGRRLPVVVSDEPRVGLIAVVRAPQGRIAVAATHLSFIPGWNVLQLRRLRRALVPCGTPSVLMGDLNLEPPAVARATGMRAAAVGPTFPAHEPVRQLDHVLVAGLDVDPSAGEPRALPLSDHLALVADL